MTNSRESIVKIAENGTPPFTGKDMKCQTKMNGKYEQRIADSVFLFKM